MVIFSENNFISE